MEQTLTRAEWHKVYSAAESLGVKKMTYWQWRQREAVPLPYAKKVAELTRISRRRLCPKVFG